MRRFAAIQPDLFAPPAPPQPEAPPPCEPLAELTELLARLRAADRLPWPDLPTAMQAEYRVMYLGRQAGAEGQKLVSAIFTETERMFAAEEQAARTAATTAPDSVR